MTLKLGILGADGRMGAAVIRAIEDMEGVSLGSVSYTHLTLPTKA